MQRLDKILSTQTNYSRKEIKELIRKKKITINENIALKSDIKIDEEKDTITINGEKIIIKKYVYLILNKPVGYVSSTNDKRDLTVLELISAEYKHRNLFPAGRLDKDTTGLMLITDDGTLAHNILSPKKHIKKTYEVTIDIPMTNEMVKGFKDGVNLNDGECKEAKLEITGTNTGIVTLTEGRYHQIKRMFGYFKAKVIKLNRIGMGNLFLPHDLNVGESRELTSNELIRLQEK